MIPEVIPIEWSPYPNDMKWMMKFLSWISFYWNNKMLNNRMQFENNRRLNRLNQSICEQLAVIWIIISVKHQNRWNKIFKLSNMTPNFRPYSRLILVTLFRLIIPLTKKYYNIEIIFGNSFLAKWMMKKKRKMKMKLISCYLEVDASISK